MRKPLLFAILGLAGAVVAAVLVISLTSNRFEYDEAAHQRVIEAYGTDVTDWDLYRDTITDVCGLEEDGFELFILQEEDLGRLQLDIQYTCPDRMGEFTDLTGYKTLD